MKPQAHPFALEEYSECDRCPLCETRDKLVLGEGNLQAEIVIIGEGPGPTEDEKGLPFVGASGVLLNKLIRAVGWNRNDLFIDNCVACWPAKETEKNWVTRKPTKEEILACRRRVTETIRRIDPLAIIALGATALYGLTGEKTAITEARGGLFFAHVPGVYKNISYPVFPTFHPAYILRQGERDDTGEDNFPVRGPSSPLALLKQDLTYVRNYLNSIKALYGRS